MTYDTKVFSGNVAKTLVFDVVGCWLYPSHSACFTFTEHTQNGKLADHEEIFSEFDKKNVFDYNHRLHLQ